MSAPTASPPVSQGERRKAEAKASPALWYFQLTKPRLTSLVVVTTLVGFLAAVPGTDGPLLLHTVFGTLLVAAAAAALNQWAERDADAFMRRTAGRPLPSGHLAPRQALTFGFVLLAVSTLLAGLAVRRIGQSERPGRFGRVPAGLVSLLLIAYLVAIWAMTTKPN